MKVENMKKILAVTALVVILSMAGTALAGGRGRGGDVSRNKDAGDCRCMMWNKEMRNGQRFPQGEVRGGWNRDGAHGFMMGRRGWQADKPRVNVPVIPQEIKDKWAEIQKTSIDLRTELGKTPLNREKALELHAKRSSLMQEISNWHFQQRLNLLEAKTETK